MVTPSILFCDECCIGSGTVHFKQIRRALVKFHFYSVALMPSESMIHFNLGEFGEADVSRMKGQVQDGGSPRRLPVPILREPFSIFAVLAGNGASFMFRRDSGGKNSGEGFFRDDFPLLKNPVH